ncbi:hypothetical protein ACHAWF_010580 [Thalassiosira exigua]
MQISAALTFAIATCRSFSVPPRSRGAALVPRLTLEEYLSSPIDINARPVLIRDIVSPEAIEALADELMAVLGDEEVQLQRKLVDCNDGSRTTEIYDIELRDSIGYMMDSNHDDSYFAFCEGLLPSSIEDRVNISRELRKIREAPFQGQEDWFDYFPPEMKPTDAIIFAGAGATSTLHRDPFEWTGTSVCLEGTKIWRFILPPPKPEGGVSVVDDALRSYRLDSIAWEAEGQNNHDEPVVLSAGWQSDLTLYSDIEDNFPSAHQWVTLEEANEDIFLRKMEDAGMAMSRLRPCADALIALDQIAKSNSSPGSITAHPSFVTAIQQPGDLLLIPAHCWHQTYAPLPSVVVASQRCGAMADGANVIQHMLEAAKCKKESLPDVLKREKYVEGTGEEAVARLVELKAGKIVSSANLSISFVESYGNEKCDGPTTLLIHGLDSSSQTWQGVQRSLSTPSVAIDCRGCGRSELGDPNKFSPEALVEDVKSLAQSHPLLSGKRFVLVGHSMGGRVAMCYAAKYLDDVSALVVEDMDIRRRSVRSNFIQNFDEEKAIAFKRGHETLDSVKKDLENIGYPSDMYSKWIDEGRIYEDKSGSGSRFWSDVNPAFRALCYRTIFDSTSGVDSWFAIADNLEQKSQNKATNAKLHLMVAGIGTVCDEKSIDEMRNCIPGGSASALAVKTYPDGTHSIHNSAREEYMADLVQIINNAG